MSDIDELARRYLASWNERDPARRRALVDELWTEDARYIDPIVAATGRLVLGAFQARHRTQRRRQVAGARGPGGPPQPPWAGADRAPGAC